MKNKKDSSSSEDINISDAINQTIDKLEAIRKLITIQNIVHRKEVIKVLNEEYLTTDTRQKIYQMFDGNHSMNDIAKKLGIKHESVRILTNDLERIGAIEIKKKVGKIKYPIRII